MFSSVIHPGPSHRWVIWFARTPAFSRYPHHMLTARWEQEHRTPSRVGPYLSCLSCQTGLQNSGLKSWWGFLAPGRSKLSWKSRHIWMPSRCTEELSSMFSGWHTICQNQSGECYQRLIFSLHFGILVLVFEQTVNKMITGGILSYSSLKSAVYLWCGTSDIFLLSMLCQTTSNHQMQKNYSQLLLLLCLILESRRQLVFLVLLQTSLHDCSSEVSDLELLYGQVGVSQIWLKPNGLYLAPSLPEHVLVFPVQRDTSVGEEVHCYTSIHAKELTGVLAK